MIKNLHRFVSFKNLTVFIQLTLICNQIESTCRCLFVFQPYTNMYQSSHMALYTVWGHFKMSFFHFNNHPIWQCIQYGVILRCLSFTLTIISKTVKNILTNIGQQLSSCSDRFNYKHLATAMHIRIRYG
jgi:hypothetical protein